VPVEPRLGDHDPQRHGDLPGRPPGNLPGGRDSSSVAAPGVRRRGRGARTDDVSARSRVLRHPA
jgi:hypothetical protein